MARYINTDGIGLWYTHSLPGPISEDDYARRGLLKCCIRSNSSTDTIFDNNSHNRIEFCENRDIRRGLILDNLCVNDYTVKAFLPEFGCGFCTNGYNHRGQKVDLKGKAMLCAALIETNKHKDLKNSGRFMAFGFGEHKTNRVIPYLNVNSTFI